MTATKKLLLFGSFLVLGLASCVSQEPMDDSSAVEASYTVEADGQNPDAEPMHGSPESN